MIVTSGIDIDLDSIAVAIDFARSKGSDLAATTDIRGGYHFADVDTYRESVHGYYGNGDGHGGGEDSVGDEGDGVGYGYPEGDAYGDGVSRGTRHDWDLERREFDGIRG